MQKHINKFGYCIFLEFTGNNESHMTKVHMAFALILSFRFL